LARPTQARTASTWETSIESCGGLEEEEVVDSEWDADAPGPAKRIYELTDDGRALLDTWAEALGGAAQTIDAFLARYEANLDSMGEFGAILAEIDGIDGHQLPITRELLPPIC
jgi:hypothetical protein